MEHNIGLIGDSWAANKYIKHLLLEAMKSKGVDAHIFQSGHNGAKSKQILKNLLDPTARFSSNSILMNNEIKFVIVIAGINDSFGHTGKRFYARHMVGIVKLLNEHNKIPVIVELPEYGIEHDNSRFVVRVKHAVCRYLFDAGRFDVIRKYRETLRAKLAKSELFYEFIDFDPFILDYEISKHLYGDTLHLNEDGVKKFCEYTANSIYKLFTNSDMQVDSTSV